MQKKTNMVSAAAEGYSQNIVPLSLARNKVCKILIWKLLISSFVIIQSTPSTSAKIPQPEQPPSVTTLCDFFLKCLSLKE